MSEAVSVAKEMKDIPRTALYAYQMLSQYSNLLSLYEQQQLVTNILWAASLTDRPLTLSGKVLPIPSVTSIRPLALMNGTTPIHIKEGRQFHVWHNKW